MSNVAMTPELLGLVAKRFKALSEPARLQILNALRTGEMTVSELVEETELGQANVSRHLSVFQLCDIMCGRLEAQMKARRKLLAL